MKSILLINDFMTIHKINSQSDRTVQSFTEDYYY